MALMIFLAIDTRQTDIITTCDLNRNMLECLYPRKLQYICEKRNGPMSRSECV